MLARFPASSERAIWLVGDGGGELLAAIVTADVTAKMVVSGCV